MNIAIGAFLGLSFIGFFVLLWYARKSLRWFDLTLMTLAFFLSIAVLPLASGVLQVRADWEKVRKDLAVRETKALNGISEIKYGKQGPVEAPPLSAIEGELNRIRADAGRIWRGVSLVNVQGDLVAAPEQAVFHLRFVPRQPADPNAAANPTGAEPPAEADPNAAPPVAAPAVAGDGTVRVPEASIVFCFAEREFDGLRVPGLYLGDFKVDKAEGNDLYLKSLLPMHPESRQAIAARRAPMWSIYELIPVDGHEPFVAAGSEPDDKQLFGRMDEDLLRKLMPQVPASTLNRYKRDGSRSEENDPPNVLWAKIEFTKKHEIVVDSGDKRNAADGGYFDTQGQAVDSRLQRGEPVTFAPPQRIDIEASAATQLKAQGVAEILDRYFVRPLNDYRFLYSNIINQLDRVAERQVVLTQMKIELDSAVERTVKLLQEEQDVKDKLEKERDQVEKEKQAIANYFKEVTEEFQNEKRLVAKLYEQNLELARRLASLHQGGQ
jgi:hypothetical protein